MAGIDDLGDAQLDLHEVVDADVRSSFGLSGCNGHGLLLFFCVFLRRRAQ